MVISMFVATGAFSKLQKNFLFTEINRRTDEYIAAHPEAEVIKVGVGDIVRPIVPAITKAMLAAVEEMGAEGGFHGYGPEPGYMFLRRAIVNDYKLHGVDIDTDEIFLSSGTKCDSSNVSEIFAKDTRIAVLDPVYPVYVATNVLAGRGGEFDANTNRYSGITYLPCLEQNDFVPELPKEEVDVVYLCYPNNPTGTSLNRKQLQVWVDYCCNHGALLLLDGAYEAFITEDDVPHSIYELDGAKECAIEFRSFSKIAGFTGTRLGYTIVPKQLKRKNEFGDTVSLNAMWNLRQCNKYNGAPYIVQRGAEAVFTPEGHSQVMAEVNFYMENARIMRESLRKAGYTVYGGVDAPYLWLKSTTPSSWDMFDDFLNRLNIIGAPGVGFGASGEGFFRLSAFNSREATLSAMQRIVDG